MDSWVDGYMTGFFCQLLGQLGR